MPKSTPTPLEDQLADIKETLEKEKVKLTPEVEKYIRNHLRVVQDKIADKKDITEGDLAFIGKVKIWILLPKNIRDKYDSIEKMEGPDVVKNAQERGLSLQQWLGLLHVAEADDKGEDWIDETFTFSGGKIICEEYLNLTNCTSLTSLPEGLNVGKDLYLRNCTSLTSLPEGLTVKGNLGLTNCTSLTYLPEGLNVGEHLHLDDCTPLTFLPEDMKVGRNLCLSGNINEYVEDDADKLRSEG